MRIAQIAPIVERVPPKKYGGTERVVHALTEELVARGHEVTLFASGDSVTTARLVSVFPRALREARLKDVYGVNNWTLLNIGLAYDSQGEFDIIHDHLAPHSLPTANISETPVVMTMHGPFSAENRKIFQTLKKPHIVTISESQVYPVPAIRHAGTVYNGLPMEHYPFGEKPDDYLLFVGRISMEKGVHFAVETAQQLDMPLIIAAKLDKVDHPYFREYIEPWLTDRIRWIGEVDEEERNKLMMRAKCLLHPVTWREPFGLTMIEAMACGCPVVAFNEGSVSEIIKTGVTGYVVHDIEAMIEAVDNIGEIDRAACRAHVLENFSVKKMADGYEAVYRKILEEKQGTAKAPRQD
ncbi:glycosyltransferase family 4 protein [Candidatus Parcubacteria bacterium]|nr:glycosyltransferase family 4 protein [Candidatus Parcubacteria bacterium]